ncbi:uncharacterized protein LOC101770842 [Setaria italica]|uniref:uncharacterized protein LOC101770842 n=1 Tax=Setaria italica TaxID=4555 RepID=UPI0003512876|nr:uncharacterized protein LOC101770842 [Setaria italica]
MVHVEESTPHGYGSMPPPYCASVRHELNQSMAQVTKFLPLGNFCIPSVLSIDKVSFSGPHYFEDLTDMLGHDISELFNADFGDNSIEEEVAEQLLIMHEECLQSNYSSIERLRNLHVQGNAVSQSRQVEGSDDGRDSSDDDDDDDALMMDDDSVAAPEEMAVDRPRPSNPVTDADGWTVVPPRHGRLVAADFVTEGELSVQYVSLRLASSVTL